MWLKERLQEKQGFLAIQLLNEKQGKSQYHTNKKELTAKSAREYEGKLQAVNDMLLGQKKAKDYSDFKERLEELRQSWSKLPESSQLLKSYKSAGMEEIENVIEQVLCESTPG